MAEKICAVYVTASDVKEAGKIGSAILSEKLAACINIYDGMTAMYLWKGKKETGREAGLIIKTKKSLVPALKKAIKRLHSYSCPCILVFEASAADKAYADWIIKETK